MPVYGNLTVVIDSSMSTYAARIASLFQTLQSISAAASLFSTTSSIEIKLDTTQGSHQGGGTISINPADFDNVKYIDFEGLTNPLTFERLITHETIHAVLHKTDPLPFGAPTESYIALLQDPNFDPIGETVTMTNEIMAQSPFGEKGQMHYFNLIEANETNPLRLLNSYTQEYVIDDVIHGTVREAHDLTINRVGSAIGSRPTDDLIIGYNGNEKIFAGGGDDHLYDGTGSDVLDGGAGNDSFYLSDDGSADIVIVGEGYDYIEGGGANDRIVLRANMLGLDPTVDTHDWSNPATGVQDGTKGVPLLGGFIYQTYPEATDAVFTPVGEKEYEYHVQPPEGPEVINYEIGGALTDRWTEFTSVNLNGDNPPSVWGSFNVHYQLQQTPWQTQAMYIEIDYWQAGQSQTAHVFIENFEEGDFGIILADKSEADMSHYQDAGTGTILFFGEEHAEYISNHGAYVTIPAVPESPAPEPQQRTAPVEEQFLQPSSDRSLSASQDSYSVSPLPEDASGWGGAQFKEGNYRDWVGYAPSHESFEYIPDGNSADQWADVIASVSSLTGGVWYEPEPIGGLV